GHLIGISASTNRSCSQWRTTASRVGRRRFLIIRISDANYWRRCKYWITGCHRRSGKSGSCGVLDWNSHKYSFAVSLSSNSKTQFSPVSRRFAIRTWIALERVTLEEGQMTKMTTMTTSTKTRNALGARDQHRRHKGRQLMTTGIGRIRSPMRAFVTCMRMKDQMMMMKDQTRRMN
ncbi:hypothetical protein H0H92_008805, partial [Tricholoma furcatifolium]